MKTKKSSSKLKSLSDNEFRQINGGWWGIAARFAGFSFAGYSFGYGWGSYRCNCPKELDISKAGPTHLRA